MKENFGSRSTLLEIFSAPFRGNPLSLYYGVFNPRRYQSMRYRLLLLAAALCSVPAGAFTAGPEVLVPAPVSYTLANGEYIVPSDGPAVKTLKLSSRHLPPKLPQHSLEGAYRLEIGRKGVSIYSNTALGEYYARASLRQLCSLSDTLRCCTVTDYPAFSWRGLMIDVSRYWPGEDFLRRQIDAMAALKMNVLHLHLTDDAGWRIELPSCPALSERTAYRLGDSWEQWGSLGYRYALEGERYASGGFLSVHSARELVDYAAQRHITIVPEIDIPAHADPILVVYPELRCLREDGTPNTDSHQLCIGNPRTRELIFALFDDLCEIFPSHYIHIGGDEASLAPWKECPRCRAYMSERGIEDVSLLQSDLVNALARHLTQKGRRPLGWDESRLGNDPSQLSLMAWHNEADAAEVARLGFECVMVPNVRAYLDYCQDAPIKEPSPMGSYLPLDSVYAYNPLEGLTERQASRVLGMQGNLWTEHVPSPEYAEYLLYPRALAIAEIGWGTSSAAQDFRSRAERFCAVSLEDYNCFDLSKEVGERADYFRPVDHLARGCKVSYNIPVSPRFTGSGEGTLTDGLLGGWSFETTRWNGFNSDMDVTLDLGEEKFVSCVQATFMGNRSVWLAVPERVSVLISDDGENFTEVASRLGEINERTSSMVYFPICLEIGQQTRYLRLVAKRKSAPFCDWIFTDEIIVR